MESSSGGRCGEIASDLFIILVTAVQLVFFVFFHEYIAWYTRGPDGSIVGERVPTAQAAPGHSDVECGAQLRFDGGLPVAHE